MQSFFLTYKSSLIHYHKAGKGNRLLLCFHGYSESCQSFSFLEDELTADFAIIAVDLPFHGKTDWKEGLDFTPQNLLDIIEQITGDIFHHSKIYLLGFSMGARVALSLLQLMPVHIEKMVLLAPDGLKTHGWYKLATQNKLGNRLFRFTMQNPGWLLSLLSIANKIRLTNQSVYKFTNAYIQDEQVRDELYKRWTCMREFRPDLSRIKSLIREHRIPARLLYGQYDRIMRSESGKQFKKGIEAFCELSILPAGHQLLHEKNREIIVHSLKT
jgi:pimeloyl-ACP methyl ester carboxylesterase